MVGISKIFLYDNDSTDNMFEEIEDFIKSGYIVYNRISGSKMQFPAYNGALTRYGYECKYMAFIDCDELIVPTKNSINIMQSLDSIFQSDENIGGVAVNWCMYGSSGFEDKPEGLMIGNFAYRAETKRGEVMLA